MPSPMNPERRRQKGPFRPLSPVVPGTGRLRLPWVRALPIVVGLSLLGWVLVLAFLFLVT